MAPETPELAGLTKTVILKQRPCASPGCPNAGPKRGFCNKHYLQKLRSAEGLPPKVRRVPYLQVKMNLSRKQVKKLTELCNERQVSQSTLFRHILDKFFAAYDAAVAGSVQRSE